MQILVIGTSGPQDCKKDLVTMHWLALNIGGHYTVAMNIGGHYTVAKLLNPGRCWHNNLLFISQDSSSKSYSNPGSLNWPLLYGARLLSDAQMHDLQT